MNSWLPRLQRMGACARRDRERRAFPPRSGGCVLSEKSSQFSMTANFLAWPTENGEDYAPKIKHVFVLKTLQKCKYSEKIRNSNPDLKSNN